MEASATFICSSWHACVDRIARQVKIPGKRGRWAGGDSTRDSKRSSARKYARIQPENANSSDYAKPVTKLLDHDFSYFVKTNKDSKCF